MENNNEIGCNNVGCGCFSCLLEVIGIIGLCWVVTHLQVIFAFLAGN